MTRKDYRMIAEVLADMKSDLDSEKNPILAFDALVSRMCHVLKADNANFNTAVFRVAVYNGDK